MLLGLLSDAHGNPLGVTRSLALLADAGVGPTYFLGDAVGYLPGESEVLRLLTDAGVECQLGNHEAMLLGELELDPERDAAYQLGAARTRMTATELDRIKSWPDVRELTVDNHKVLMVHGSPRAHLTEYIYPDSELDWLGDLGYDAIFLGNTHRPFVTYRGQTLIANVGSCGLPRDQGDLPSCAVYDTVANTCEILRVRLPAAEVLAQFDQSGDFLNPIHPIVAECLHRSVEQPIGTIVEHSS